MDGGIARVTLYAVDPVVLYSKDAFGVQVMADQYGWGGMRWYYDAGDGRKAELESNWYNIMPPYGYVEPTGGS